MSGSSDEKSPPTTSKRPGTAGARLSSPVRTPRPSSPSRGTPKTPLSDTDSSADSLCNPSRTEILRMENELKVKDMELTRVLTESKALRQTNLAMEKAISSLSEETARLKERLSLAEKTIDSKTLELKQANELRKSILSDQAAAEATIRRLQASHKDNCDNGAEEARAKLEAELKLAQKEIVRLQEETKTQDRQMKAKESALLEAERDINSAFAKAARVDELENKCLDLQKQLEASQEETKTLDRLYKMKVDELKKQSEKIEQLQESLLAAGAVHSIIRDYERQLQEHQVNQKVLNEELARAKVAASRVAMAVANEYKDDNDKVIPVKQWLEERRVLQGEISRLKERLVAAEKTTKYEIQMKTKAQCRLKVIEDSLKSPGQVKGTPSPRLTSSRSRTLGSDSTEPDHGSTDNTSTEPPSEDLVAGVLYDALQREVVTLRKQATEREHAYKDKEASHDMLMKKVELLMKAMDVDSRRYRRDLNSLKDEVTALKAELQARGPRRPSASPRVSRG